MHRTGIARRIPQQALPEAVWWCPRACVDVLGAIATGVRSSLWGATMLAGSLIAGLSSSVSAAGAQSREPTAVTAASVSGPDQQAILARYGELPLMFEKNAGQTDRQVDFLVRGHGYQVFLTPAGVAIKVAARRKGAIDSGAADAVNAAAVHLRWRGARADVQASGIDEMTSKANYFRGGDAAQHLSDISTFGRVRYAGLYPGIDLVYYGTQGQLEYDLIVAPGADPRQVRFAVDGALGTELDLLGDLVVRTAAGNVSLHRPVVYQTIKGQRKNVPARYVHSGENDFGVSLAAYDKKAPLIIDPVLSYGTFLGGKLDDGALAIAVDGSGNAYVAGYTLSSDFPTATAYQRNLSSNGGKNAFITKFNAAGSALAYSTYLGSNGGYERIVGIAVDASGSAYVTGFTASSTFPVTGGAYQTGVAGGNSFVTKLAASGSALAYSTYVLNALTNGIAIDTAGNAYITGQATSPFRTTAGAFQTTFKSTSGTNAFAASLNATGTAMRYATLLGGTGNDSGNSIAVDSNGYAYVAGSTSSSDFPISGAYQMTLRGMSDGFVSKLNPSGNALAYSTFFGGSLDDSINGIAIDGKGNAYVVGETYSSNLPVRNAFQPQKPGANMSGSSQGSAFVAKILAGGDAIAYSSFIGGELCKTPCSYSGPLQRQADIGQRIAADSLGHAYITGFANSAAFPLLNSLLPAATDYPSQAAAFVAKIGVGGNTVMYSTLTSRNANEPATNSRPTYSVATDSVGSAYGTGSLGSDGGSGTYATTYLLSPGAYKTTRTLTSGGDVTVYKLTSAASVMTLTSSSNPVTAQAPFSLTASIADTSLQGSVAFFDGNAQIGTATLSAGTAVLAVALPAGVHRFTAAYRTSTATADAPMLYQVVDPALVCN